MIRWLFHDWKRLADREAQFIIQPEPPRDPYSVKGVSIDPGLRRVEHPQHEETDHLIKKIQVDPGKLGGMGGPGGMG